MDAQYLIKKLERLTFLVTRMRYHQREYFRVRASVDLDKAKYYEKQVDAFLKEDKKEKDSPQKELF